jgi:hypothetical protein
VAHCAVHGLEIFVVRQLDAIKITMAIDAPEIGVNRRREGFRIHEDRDLIVALLTHQIRVLVAHQTVFVFLCRYRCDEDRKQQDAGNDAKPPQSSESSFFIADVVHPLLQIRAGETR